MRNVVAASISLLSLAGSALGCSTFTGVKLTAYGYPDASGTPAYKCNGNTPVNTVAGDKTLLGDGSFNKPYAAAASRSSVFARCSMIYVPILEKYFRIQDDCSGCVSKQADLYIAQYNSNVGQTNCELAFGTFNYKYPTHTVLGNPTGVYLTNAQPLFANGVCYNNPSQGRFFPNRDDNAKCAAGTAAQAETAVEFASNNASDPSPFDNDPAGRHKNDESGPQ